MSISNFSRSLISLALLAILSACSQARKGIGNAGTQDNLWQPLELCQVPAGAQLLGCFDLQLDVTSNIAYMDVKQLGFNPNQVTYRVLGQIRNHSGFSVLLDNINIPVGGTVQIPAKGNNNIYDYDQWRVELTAWTTNQIDWFPTSAGQGKLVAQVITNWPELQSLLNNNTTGR